MSPLVYQLIHVFSILMLSAIIFAIFGGASTEKRKLLMALSGIFGLLALIGGFGLATKIYGMPNPMSWPFWIWGKVVLWLGLMAMGGLAYRRPGLVPVLVLVTTALLFGAVYLVYFKPSLG